MTGSEKASHVLALQVAKDTEPYVPFLTGSLTLRTRVIDDNIIYPAPYARYLWNGVAMKDSVTGKGPRKIAGVGYRWRAGATLVPSSQPLTYTRQHHPMAQAHWFEASKEANIEKWQRVAANAVIKYGYK